MFVPLYRRNRDEDRFCGTPSMAVFWTNRGRWPTCLFVGPKAARARIFTDREWRAFWNATGATPYPYGPLFRVLALTGQRRSEVAEARWREFDLTVKLWSIPPQRMKSAAAHVVPLTVTVVAILERLGALVAS